jgi:hypothetical protein
MKVEANLKAEELVILEKEWKAKEQQRYIRNYYELLETLATSIEAKVP